MPGQTLDDMQIASMKPSEKCELGKKLAQYVHWFAQAIPLGSKAFENTYNDEESRRFDKRALLLDTDQARLSRDLEEVGQYTLASVRDEQVQQYIKMRNEGIITERTLVGHNDLKPSNFVFNSDLEGNLVLTSVIDYEATKPSTPEQEFRRTPQMGEDVMYIAIEEYERLTGIVLDPEVIKFWERVHFVGWAVNSALRSFADNDRVVLTRELRRTYPDQDWREVSGEITYSSSV